MSGATVPWDITLAEDQRGIKKESRAAYAAAMLLPKEQSYYQAQLHFSKQNAKAHLDPYILMYKMSEWHVLPATCVL